ncbi:MAG: hypothetical protein OXM55_03940 [Bdellovibrionales bacterium]|nr:hypothetical protein [Bdellovibrionales bacterium]
MLDKKDKKFISALAFAQTGLLLMGITLSGYFWYHSLLSVQGMKHLYEISQMLNERKDQVEILSKLKEIEDQYENQGIGVSSDSQE